MLSFNLLLVVAILTPCIRCQDFMQNFPAKLSQDQLQRLVNFQGRTRRPSTSGQGHRPAVNTAGSAVVATSPASAPAGSASTNATNQHSSDITVYLPTTGPLSHAHDPTIVGLPLQANGMPARLPPSILAILRELQAGSRLNSQRPLTIRPRLASILSDNGPAAIRPRIASILSDNGPAAIRPRLASILSGNGPAVIRPRLASILSGNSPAAPITNILPQMAQVSSAIVHSPNAPIGGPSDLLYHDTISTISPFDVVGTLPRETSTPLPLAWLDQTTHLPEIFTSEAPVHHIHLLADITTTSSQVMASPAAPTTHKPTANQPHMQHDTGIAAQPLATPTQTNAAGQGLAITGQATHVGAEPSNNRLPLDASFGNSHLAQDIPSANGHLAHDIPSTNGHLGPEVSSANVHLSHDVPSSNGHLGPEVSSAIVHLGPEVSANGHLGPELTVHQGATWSGFLELDPTDARITQLANQQAVLPVTGSSNNPTVTVSVTQVETLSQGFVEVDPTDGRITQLANQQAIAPATQSSNNQTVVVPTNHAETQFNGLVERDPTDARIAQLASQHPIVSTITETHSSNITNGQSTVVAENFNTIPQPESTLTVGNIHHQPLQEPELIEAHVPQNLPVQLDGGLMVDPNGHMPQLEQEQPSAVNQPAPTGVQTINQLSQAGSDAVELIATPVGIAPSVVTVHTSSNGQSTPPAGNQPGIIPVQQTDIGHVDGNGILETVIVNADPTLPNVVVQSGTVPVSQVHTTPVVETATVAIIEGQAILPINEPATPTNHGTIVLDPHPQIQQGGQTQGLEPDPTDARLAQLASQQPVLDVVNTSVAVPTTNNVVPDVVHTMVQARPRFHDPSGRFFLDGESIEGMEQSEHVRFHPGPMSPNTPADLLPLSPNAPAIHAPLQVLVVPEAPPTVQPRTRPVVMPESVLRILLGTSDTLPSNQTDAMTTNSTVDAPQVEPVPSQQPTNDFTTAISDIPASSTAGPLMETSQSVPEATSQASPNHPLPFDVHVSHPEPGSNLPIRVHISVFDNRALPTTDSAQAPASGNLSVDSAQAPASGTLSVDSAPQGNQAPMTSIETSAAPQQHPSIANQGLQGIETATVAETLATIDMGHTAELTNSPIVPASQPEPVLTLGQELLPTPILEILPTSEPGILVVSTTQTEQAEHALVSDPAPLPPVQTEQASAAASEPLSPPQTDQVPATVAEVAPVAVNSNQGRLTVAPAAQPTRRTPPIVTQRSRRVRRPRKPARNVEIIPSDFGNAGSIEAAPSDVQRPTIRIRLNRIRTRPSMPRWLVRRMQDGAMQQVRRRQMIDRIMSMFGRVSRRRVPRLPWQLRGMSIDT